MATKSTQPANQSGMREERRACRGRLLASAYMIVMRQGRPLSDAGKRTQRLFYRNLHLKDIRQTIERLPKNERPLISWKCGVLILDYGVYETRHDLRSFRIELTSDTIGGYLRHAESLANRYKESPSPIESGDASACLSCVAALRKRLHDLDAFGDDHIVVTQVTQTDARTLIRLGRLIERLEFVFPRQKAARLGLPLLAFVPSAIQQVILDELNGCAMTGEQLLAKLRCGSKETLYGKGGVGGLSELVEINKVKNDRRIGGYFRPDARPRKRTKGVP